MRKFIGLFGVKRIKYLLGDRVFAGKRWFSFLYNQLWGSIVEIHCGKL